MFEHRWSPEANCLPTKRTPPPDRSARQAKSPASTTVLRRRDAWPAHVALLGHVCNCNSRRCPCALVGPRVIALQNRDAAGRLNVYLPFPRLAGSRN